MDMDELYWRLNLLADPKDVVLRQEELWLAAICKQDAHISYGRPRSLTKDCSTRLAHATSGRHGREAHGSIIKAHPTHEHEVDDIATSQKFVARELFLSSLKHIFLS